MKIQQLPTKENPIRSETGAFWVEGGVIYRSIIGETMTGEAAKKDTEIVKEIAKLLGTPVKLLVLMNKGKITREARKLFEETTFINKLAIVVSSPTMKIIASFFQGFNKSNAVTEIFNSEKEAFLWLGNTE